MLLTNGLFIFSQMLRLAGTPDPPPPVVPVAVADAAPDPAAPANPTQPTKTTKSTKSIKASKTTKTPPTVPPDSTQAAAPAAPTTPGTQAAAPAAPTTPGTQAAAPAAPTTPGTQAAAPAAKALPSQTTAPVAPAPVTQAAAPAAKALTTQAAAPAAQTLPSQAPSPSGVFLNSSPQGFPSQAPPSGAFPTSSNMGFPTSSNMGFPTSTNMGFPSQAPAHGASPTPGTLLPSASPAPPQDGAPAASPVPGIQPPAEGAAPAPEAKERLYSMSVESKEVDHVITALEKASGETIRLIHFSNDLLSLKFSKVPFKKALAMICRAVNLEYTESEGVYWVGQAMALHVKFPVKGETQLEAIFRCKHLQAQSLVTALRDVVAPGVRVGLGPMFLSPSTDANADAPGSNDGSQSGSQTMRALSATDSAFKVHDIIIYGPAAEVRKALMLAEGFDRPRRQVMINIRIVEVDNTLTKALGISWDPTLTMTATENSNATSNGGTPSVAGIRMGSFSHAPLVVNATLNALESKGKVKTLSNPSIRLLDGERSFILSGEKVQYPKYSQTNQAGQSLYDVAELKIGVYLQVAVQIGVNNDVVMTIMPQVTNLVKFQTYNSGEYPIVTTQEAQTTVRAYSGEMIVLGGLKTNTESEERDGIPFLKDLPVLGRFFSNVTKIKNSSELMIFITPEIENPLDNLEVVDIPTTD